MRTPDQQRSSVTPQPPYHTPRPQTRKYPPQIQVYRRKTPTPHKTSRFRAQHPKDHHGDHRRHERVHSP